MNAIIKEDIDKILTGGLDFSPLKGKTVLVTGAYGMLASYLVYTFAELNERDPFFDLTIEAQGRSPEKMTDRFEDYEGKGWFRPVYDDIATLDAGMADFIIHAASPTDPRTYLTYPSAVIHANVTATEHLLEEAREGVAQAFLFVSSGEVYGRLEKDLIEEEDGGHVTTSDPRNVYALSKLLGERLCRDTAEKDGLRACIVRPSHTYGPTMNLEGDGRVFADFTRSAVRGEDIVMTSDGLATRAFTYLSDAAEGYLRVLLGGEAGQAYNVTNNEGIRSIREIAEILRENAPQKIKTVFGEPDPTYRENANRRASVRSTKKLETLGWQARISPEEGFARTLSAFLLSS